MATDELWPNRLAEFENPSFQEVRQSPPVLAFNVNRWNTNNQVGDPKLDKAGSQGRRNDSKQIWTWTSIKCNWWRTLDTWATKGDSSQGQMWMQMFLHLWELTFRVELSCVASGAKLRCTLYKGLPTPTRYTIRGLGLLYMGCDSFWLPITIYGLKNTRSRSCQQDARIIWKKIAPVPDSLNLKQ